MEVVSVQTSMTRFICENTNNRIEIISKNLPDDLKFHFKVEGNDMIHEWNIWWSSFQKTLASCKGIDIFGMGIYDYNKFAYFTYFFGSFFKHNGSDDDVKYVDACYAWLRDNIGFIDGKEYNLAELFYKSWRKK